MPKLRGSVDPVASGNAKCNAKAKKKNKCSKKKKTMTWLAAMLMYNADAMPGQLKQ